MPQVRQRPWVVAGGVAALALLAAAVVLLVMAADLNRNKARLERAASDAIGMQVRIDGRVDLALFPRLHVGLRDGRILDANGATVLAVKRVRVGIGWLPLLRGKLRLRRIELLEPRLSVRKDRAGRVPLEALRKATAFLGAIDGATLSLSNGTLAFTNDSTGAGIEASGVELAVTRLQLSRGDSTRFWAGSTFHARLRCAAIRTKHLRISDLRLAIDGHDGAFALSPVTLDVFGGHATGRLGIDLSRPVPELDLHATLSRFRIEQALRMFSSREAAVGEMNVTAALTFRGTTRDELVRGSSGTLSMRGSDLTLTGNDLDRALARFESGRSFTLGDIGGLFVAGPLSLIVTRGYSFAGLFRGSGGTSHVQKLVSDWNVVNGVARAQDVALATAKNRIALQGRLDFVTERFEDVIVAAVDKHGCARVRQVIHGPFLQPTVDKPRVLATLAGPVIDVLGRIRRAIPGTHCPVFYAGSVAAPE